MIRDCAAADFEVVLDVVNDAAQAYRGVIPADCWHEPYMSAGALARELEAGVTFRGFERDAALIGVMGRQAVEDVLLIRHAYVRTAHRRHGIGGALLEDLRAGTTRPILIGTWAAARWAIDFYRRHGFALVPAAQTGPLLRRYWSVPERQIETSVVLADRRGLERR